MGQFISTFRAEIRRLAKKEARALTAAPKKASAQHRREIAALKRSVRNLERRLMVLELTERKRVAAGANSSAPATAEGTRFSPRWLLAHRTRIKLSAADYGKLLGVSALSVYQWEKGETKPQKSKLAALSAVRKMRQREAVQRLALLKDA